MEHAYPMPAFPTLSTLDLEASRRFYVDGLGFHHVFSISGPDGRPVVEHIRFARYADVLLEQEHRASDGATTERGLGVRLSFSLALANRDCNEFAQRARAFGARVVGPVERPWNTREVEVIDPDGYVLVFTEPVDPTRSFDDVLEGIATSPGGSDAPAESPAGAVARKEGAVSSTRIGRMEVDDER
jgi:catechol 2,3-dioxygenase-like lactoylglutathione lyase family enzyme